MVENETFRMPIRDLHSSRMAKPRFCDYVIKDGVEYFEKKEPGKEAELIRVDDFIYQYNAAKEAI